MVWILFSFYLSKDGTYNFSYFQVLGEERLKDHLVPLPQLRTCFVH